MTTLVYGMITSLDGYTQDAAGGFDWAEPDRELHAYVNERESAVGCYLYGRRMYETMRYWQDADDLGDDQVLNGYAAIWQAADKVVFSRTLDRPTTPRTRLEHSFEPDAIPALVGGYDRVSISGPEIAAQALEAGLIDEIELYVVPVAVGGGTPLFPRGRRLDLALRSERRFAGGAVHLSYDVRRREPRR